MPIKRLMGNEVSPRRPRQTAQELAKEDVQGKGFPKLDHFRFSRATPEVRRPSSPPTARPPGLRSLPYRTGRNFSN